MNGRQRWGGIWKAPKRYSFVATTSSQYEVDLVKKYDNWKYATVRDTSYHKLMPYLAGDHRLLTTDSHRHEWYWGTLIAGPGNDRFGVAPVIRSVRPTDRVYYWVREEQVGK